MSPDRNLTSARWIKSSYSSSSGGECLEFSRAYLEFSRSRGPVGTVPVRDSKTPDGPVLVFRASGWTSFVTAVRSSRFPAR